MEDWEVDLEDLCCDLVTECQFEPVLTSLLVKNSAQWTHLMSLAQSSNIDLTQYADVARELYIVWLSHPNGDSGYDAVILFYDVETRWSKGACYNRQRLLRDTEITKEDSE